MLASLLIGSSIARSSDLCAKVWQVELPDTLQAKDLLNPKLGFVAFKPKLDLPPGWGRTVHEALTANTENLAANPTMNLPLIKNPDRPSYELVLFEASSRPPSVNEPFRESTDLQNLAGLHDYGFRALQKFLKLRNLPGANSLKELVEANLGTILQAVPQAHRSRAVLLFAAIRFEYPSSPPTFSKDVSVLNAPPNQYPNRFPTRPGHVDNGLFTASLGLEGDTTWFQEGRGSWTFDWKNLLWNNYAVMPLGKWPEIATTPFDSWKYIAQKYIRRSFSSNKPVWMLPEGACLVFPGRQISYLSNAQRPLIHEVPVVTKPRTVLLVGVGYADQRLSRDYGIRFRPSP